MGGLVKTIFGGSSAKNSSKSESGNQAYGTLSGLLSGNIGQGNNAMGTLSALLGLGGDKAAGDKAYTNYLDSTGFNSMLDASTKALTSSSGAKGLFQSGAAGKALQGNAVQLGKQNFNDYLGQLTGLGNYGMQSAQTLAGAGQTSSASATGKSSSQNGIFNSLFPGGLSDRRWKTNVTKLRTAPDGLGIYSFEYLFDMGRKVIGVMADEVARLRPEALGPKWRGYGTVDYSKLTEA